MRYSDRERESRDAIDGKARTASHNAHSLQRCSSTRGALLCLLEQVQRAQVFDNLRIY